MGNARGSRHCRTRWTTVGVVLAVLVGGCTGSPVAPAPTGAASTTTTAPPTTTVPPAALALAPAAGAVDVSPAVPATIAVTGGTLADMALTAADGTVVPGTADARGTAYTVAHGLGYGATYTWSGTARATTGTTTPVSGSFTTLTPVATARASINIGDDRTVGIAAPIIVQFSSPVEDRAAVEMAMVVTTDPPTVGSWAWLPDEAAGARAHWRPKDYWVPGTTVDVAMDLLGQQYEPGVYAKSDLTTHFTVGRSQVVTADVTTHRMQVVRDGVQVMDVPVSYGKGDENRNTTRTGVHVVTETIENKLMTNPPYYENVLEHWSVRISNNGEFIHANPQTVGVQGSRNVSNGCVNLSTADARAYFDTVLYGDPVEVTGTDVALSARDGDVYDWALSWTDWQALSALG